MTDRNAHQMRSRIPPKYARNAAGKVFDQDPVTPRHPFEAFQPVLAPKSATIWSLQALLLPLPDQGEFWV